MVDEKKFLDQSGVEYLWSQLSLEDYPNNETLIAVLNAIDATKADKDELFSGSWNDLKDKPFGDEGIIELLHQTSFNANEHHTYSDNVDGKYTTVELYQANNLPILTEMSFVEGEHYTVVFDNVEYDCVYKPTSFGYYLGEDGEYSYGYYEMPNPYGYPFCILPYNGRINCLTEGEHTVAIYGTRLKQIDEQYIPDSIARTSYVDEAIAAIPTPDVSGQIEAHNTDEAAHAYIRATIDAKADAVHVHSWNELEDKPFGETTTLQEVAIFPEVEFYPSGSGSVRYDHFDNNLWPWDAGSGFGLNVGQTYIVCIGYAKYEVVCDNSMLLSGEYITIKNYPDQAAGVNNLTVQETKNRLIGTYDVILCTQESSTVLLDEQYISDTIARTEYVDTQLATKSDSDHNHNDLYYTEIEVNNLLNEKINISALDNYYTKTEVEQFHDEITDYVDDEVAALVNAAPETLDTLGELATAFAENKEVVDALDASITNKQDKISDTLILVDTITGLQHKIQIQNGQLVSFPVE